MADPTTVKNFGLIILSFYIIVFVGLSYITTFMQTDLKGIVVAKERGDSFKTSLITNFSDLYRCSPIVGDASNVGPIRTTLVFVMLAQLVSFIISVGLLFQRTQETTPRIVLGIILFALFLVVNIPLWILINRLDSKNLIRVTDNTRDYDCIKFTSKTNVQNMLNLIYLTWFFSIVQAVFVLLYSLFYSK